MRECYCCKKEYKESEGSLIEASKRVSKNVITGEITGHSIEKRFVCNNCNHLGE